MTDPWVLRLKRQPRNQYNAKLEVVVYRCKFCPFKTRRLTRAWLHGESHGPWPEELGGSKGELLARAKQRRN